MTPHPEPGDIRYKVELLDYAQGVAIMKAAGADPDKDSFWDFCQQHEITVYETFPSKWRAVEWAKRNKRRDVFNTPRIVEETYSDRSWEQTGYWETDGRTEIDPTEYPRS